MRSATAYGWILAAITLGALALRTVDLTRRPMHADEANQAVKAGELLETSQYAFDPADHHGPTLYYAAVAIAWVRAERSLADLSEFTVRLVPAIAGTLSVVVLAILAAPFGRATALLAAAFLTVAPPAVYYSRYFVQETLLVLFTVAALGSGMRWWRTGRLTWAVATGVGAGLMQATKATAPLFAVVALVALWISRPARPATPRLRRDIVVMSLSALIIVAAFYSSFGTHPAGLRDALGTYGNSVARISGGESGHEKPWWYYFQLLTWQRSGGLLWQELAGTLLAVAGAAVAFRLSVKFPRWVASYTIGLAIVLAVTPYKTPWHVIHLLPGMSLLAGNALVAMTTTSWMRGAAVAIGATALVVMGLQTRLVVFQRPADPRNPFAYVHSSPDVLKFRAIAERALAAEPGGTIRVIADEYWPLPWYLRGLPRVGYWNAPPGECDGALVITSAADAATVRGRMHGHYHETILGLRPEVVCVVFEREP